MKKCDRLLPCCLSAQILPHQLCQYTWTEKPYDLGRFLRCQSIPMARTCRTQTRGHVASSQLTASGLGDRTIRGTSLRGNRARTQERAVSALAWFWRRTKLYGFMASLEESTLSDRTWKLCKLLAHARHRIFSTKFGTWRPLATRDKWELFGTHHCSSDDTVRVEGRMAVRSELGESRPDLSTVASFG